MNYDAICDFVRESNKIEGISRISAAEVKATEAFRALDHIEVADVVKLVGVYAPHAQLRVLHGLNVRVGPHIPPPGGPPILANLESILMTANKGICSPYEVHQRYETLHPFTDGNGRSGRAIWLWQMRDAPLGFLHSYYYQSLQASR